MGVIKKKTAIKATEGGVKIICDICSSDITSTVRIRCADPACKDYDLCVPCFARGESSRDHKPATHPYCVIEQHSVPIFTADWGADEESLLLEGAETYGLGSWADIADHIGGYRHKDEVRDHYISTYIDSDRFPLPNHADPKNKRLIEEWPREKFQARKKRRIEDRKEELKNEPAAPPKQKPVASTPICHEVQGYMPGRLEFEHEHNDAAEEAVQHMQFEPGEGIDPDTGEIEPEMVLKMVVMDIYNARLTGRVERKRLIFEHQLLEYRRNMAMEKKKTNEERELLKKCKPMAKLMRKTDFDDFTKDMEYELNLRQAIGQLQDWRNNQIGDLKSGEEYEQKKAARIARIAAQSSYDRFATSRPVKSQPPEGNPAVAHLVSPSMSRITNGVSPEPNSKHVNGLPNGTPLKSEIESRALANGASTANATPAPESKRGTTPAATHMPLPQRSKFTVAPLPNTVPLDLATGDENAYPDNRILTEDERELISQLRIAPRAYAAIKEAILREAVRLGGSMKKKMAKEVARIDPAKVGKIFDFMVHNGWIGRA
ncbi:MAG: hypothetical protein Q9162_006106 [Coniocarpon cinnabarinum]